VPDFAGDGRIRQWRAGKRLHPPRRITCRCFGWPMLFALAALVTNYLAEIADRLVLAKEQSDLALQLTASATTMFRKSLPLPATSKRITPIKRLSLAVGREFHSICPRLFDTNTATAKTMLCSRSRCSAPREFQLRWRCELYSPIREDLPSLDQFDHMLVHAPLAGKDFFLDCTAKSADLTALWTFGLSAGKVCCSIQTTQGLCEFLNIQPTRVQFT